MKKILVSLATIGLLAAPLVGLAAMEMTNTCDITHDLDDYVGCEGIGGEQDASLYADCCLIDKILTIGDWIFTALLVVAILVILLAAWGFLTAGGDPEKVKKSRDYLIYALVGIAVAFLAKVLVRVVASIMT